MIKKALVALTTILVVGAGSVTQSYAFQPGGFARQLEWGRTRTASPAPLQMQLFCLQNPQDCKASKSKLVSYTPRVQKLLHMVNASVNASIIPRNEKIDVWSINPRYGDCDDYVMTKRHRLIKAGIPASALRVAMVRTRWGEGHAVLLVKTDAGEYVLDNLKKTVVQRKRTAYSYVSVSGSNALAWN
ncbi:transglutaminase-like cysteine peptidase [Rhizobium glycinendophyticum]|uniref:Transglutaminase n=1 Tax=Rhizobium glycinendophyticum TaxID=2589807 RepID=A0A504TM08_9HYPH|nr:transglutaminase-like cysteine peptidase [Rhizobium glycinendophyticum]TPP03698.1 hypothetical protein FJQ55_23220 [Rhizobium glycinendophyticum]